MEALTRFVAESLARHGFDRPLDYRRLHWSRWFRCESHHSLLSVPSKPGVFALAEQIGEIGKAHVEEARHMLAVSQFYEADDMAFMLDRMLSYQNPMRARLASGSYFFRFVVIEDAAQRRSVSNALNTWMTSGAEKAIGIGSHFANSLELTPEQKETGMPHLSPVLRDAGIATEGSECAVPKNAAALKSSLATPHLDSGAAANIHCPPFPSGF